MKTPSSLLPSGFVDLMPPDAWRERKLRSAVLERFRSFGYEEVTPPLLEFEDSLLDKAALQRQTFRVMDPVSQRMMGLRADMTPQIARIAASRMKNAALPLRLCYAGTCLRVKGEGLYQSRQLIQAGIECIGYESESALVEMLRCAQEALEAIGISDISLDVALPKLAKHMLADLPRDERRNLRSALRQKDRYSVRQLAHPLASQLMTLMDCTTLESLRSHAAELPPMVNSWVALLQNLSDQLPQLTFTLDPLEESGFGYYDGMAFSIFSRSLGCEIGRGGRYIAHNGLPACGFTLYLTPLIRSSTLTDETPRCLIMSGADEAVAKALREKGWHSVYATAKTAAEAKQEALRLRCAYWLEKDEVKDV